MPDLNKLNNLLNKFVANQKRMRGINIEKWFEFTSVERKRAELMKPMNFTNHLPKGKNFFQKKVCQSLELDSK